MVPSTCFFMVFIFLRVYFRCTVHYVLPAVMYLVSKNCCKVILVRILWLYIDMSQVEHFYEYEHFMKMNMK